MTTATVTTFRDEIETKRGVGDSDLYRYRCSFCGKTGRWMKDGATVNHYLRRHQGDSMERTPCPNIR